MLTQIGIGHELRTLVRGAISVNPMFVRHLTLSNVAVVPIADKARHSSRGSRAKLRLPSAL